MKNHLLPGAALFVLAAAPAFAQTGAATPVDGPDGSTTTTPQTVKKEGGGTAPGAAGGVVAGALVAGPIGALIGGIAGATIGHTVAPPSEVKTYVTTQSVAPIAYSGDVRVGKTIDGDVAWSRVPHYPKYSWARLNGQRVVIDNDSHKVVAVY